MGRDLCAFKVKEYASFRGQMDTWALLFLVNTVPAFALELCLLYII